MSLYTLIKFTPVFWKCLGRLPMRHLVYMARQFGYENPHCHDGRIYINSFFPPYPSKAFDRFLEAVLKCWRVPFSTYFAVTDECPYRCPHCSYGKHVRGKLDTERAIEIIRQIKSIGTVTLGFTGGEPLLRQDIAQLVAAAGEDTASVMFSTGYSLTRARAKELFKAGLDCMTIGMESDDPAAHDHTRSVAGSYDTAISAIRLSLEAGLYTAISTVATRKKLTDGTLEKLADLATRLGVHEFRILEPVPTGSFSEQTGEILTSRESKQLALFHTQWNRKGKGPAIACFAYLESDAMFGCGAGFHHLFIDAVGNVCPCDLTPLKLGNVFEESLADIWNRMSRWFDLPRCGCLMKQLCQEPSVFENAVEFPLGRDKSEQICGQLQNDGILPTVFANLFRNRKPINPPLTRR